MSNIDVDGDLTDVNLEVDTDSEIEKRARRMGWRPESEWNDNGRARRPPKFLSADEYLDKVENDLPVLRERNRFLDETVVALKTQVAEVGTRLNETADLVKTLHDENKKVGQRAYERAKRELEAEKRAAVLEADPEKFDAAQAKIEELEKVAAPPPPPPPTPPATTEKPRPPSDPVTTAWISENKWFNADPVLNNYAIEINGEINRESPGISAADALAETKRLVMEKFPEKFGINPRRGAPSTVVTPGAPNNPRRGNGRSFDDLPDDARQTFAKLQKQFKSKGIDYTKDEYVADYRWD